jgi:subtilisin-like proprotein convertase family protein
MRLAYVSILVMVALSTSCVKDDGKVAAGDSLGNSTSGSSGGGSGSSSTPVPDPLASQAWHLANTGQNSFSSGNGISGEDISVAAAISLGFTGLGVRVAVSDTGTDINHEDLTNRQLEGEHRNYATSNSSLWRTTLPYVVENDAHGTGVAGLISAQGWNGLGSRGVAPDSKFAAFRFVGDYSATAASLLARTIDQTDGNFDIFNYSYGYSQCQYIEEDDLLIDSFVDGVKNLRSGKGALYVQSAGNSFINYTYGCVGNTNTSHDLTIPEKIIVGAINANGKKSSYSSPGSGIWVSSPGGEYGISSPAMITTDISGCGNGYSRINPAFTGFDGGNDQNKNCSYTSSMNGTSSAAPVLSGVIALMLQANPSLTWRDVKHILALTSDQVDYSLATPLTHPLGTGYDSLLGYIYDYKWIQNAAGIDFSNWYGFGRVNALSAVIMANTYTFPMGAYESTENPQTKSWYYNSGVISDAIPENDPNGTFGLPGSSIIVNHNFFIESVQLKVNITHTFPSDVGISLISPSGTESRILHYNSLISSSAVPTDKLLLTNAFYGENSAGTWTLKVDDGALGDTGTVTNWKIQINGHRMAGDGSFPNPVAGATMPATYPSAGNDSTSPPLAFTFSSSGDVVRYELSVGTSPRLVDISKWTSIGLNNTSAQLTKLSLITNRNYYLNIRAIDNMENASSIVSKLWQTY